ncbi:MAG: hypothetical protein OHK0017_12370 [Patescibacteria group bacterium]
MSPSQEYLNLNTSREKSEAEIFYQALTIQTRSVCLSLFKSQLNSLSQFIPNETELNLLDLVKIEVNPTDKVDLALNLNINLAYIYKYFQKPAIDRADLNLCLAYPSSSNSSGQILLKFNDRVIGRFQIQETSRAVDIFCYAIRQALSGAPLNEAVITASQVVITSDQEYRQLLNWQTARL